MVVEVELKIFLTKEQYNHLESFFRKEGEFLNEDNQETFYFTGKDDLRIQRNDFYSKLVLKKGKVHDEAREEFEVKFSKEEFESLERLFLALGYEVQIKWLRKRLNFNWQGVSVSLDNTKGYGMILELEKLSDEAGKAKALEFLKQKAKELNLEVTPREEFEKKYAFYKEHWQSLI